MTKTEAHALLDAAQAGARVNALEITQALRATGDIGRHEQAPTVLHASHKWPWYATETGQQEAD